MNIVLKLFVEIVEPPRPKRIVVLKVMNIVMKLIVKMFLFTACNTTTQYTCIEGGCIPKSQVCDGHVDCPYITGTNVSDEEFCSEFKSIK